MTEYFEDMTSTIRITRPKGYMDRLRSYRIVLNGNEAGKIGPGDTLEVTAPAGKNTLEGTIDWAKSAPFEIVTKQGETVEVEIANSWGAWGPFVGLWATTFGANGYLKFTRKSGPQND